MLIKMLSFDFSTMTAAKVFVQVTDNSGTAIDITGQTVSAAWFALTDYTPATPISITGLTAGLGATPAQGQITLTFDAAANNVSLGDILVLSAGAIILDTPPFSKILNTATVDTSLTTITELGMESYLKTPITNKTADQNYQFQLDYLNDNGTQITPTVLTLTNPIIVQGLTIASVKIVPITVGTGTNNNEYSPNADFKFTVKFCSDVNGNNPIEFDAATTDFLSLSFKPVS